MESINEKYWPIYHEVGHWMISRGLSHKGYITGNIKENNEFRFQGFTCPQKNTIQGLKENILIAFGGIGAEKILDIPQNAGCIGDLAFACDYLKQLYSLENKVFEFKNYMDFPDKEYDYYLSQAKIVLNQLGGKETILSNGKYVYEKLSENREN